MIKDNGPVFAQVSGKRIFKIFEKYAARISLVAVGNGIWVGTCKNLLKKWGRLI